MPGLERGQGLQASILLSCLTCDLPVPWPSTLCQGDSRLRSLPPQSSLAGEMEPLSISAQNEVLALSWDFEVVRGLESSPNPV